jgi:rRNA-processing protein FCF1
MRTRAATIGIVPSVVLVDAENVRRSRWPNIGARDLRRLCAAWAEREGVEVEVVFEPGRGTADDVIARRARELAAAGTPYWLVTSDRGLRERAGAEAERVVGGGAFAGELLEPG